jgi:hypothetical protein
VYIHEYLELLALLNSLVDAPEGFVEAGVCLVFVDEFADGTLTLFYPLRDGPDRFQGLFQEFRIFADPLNGLLHILPVLGQDPGDLVGSPFKLSGESWKVFAKTLGDLPNICYSGADVPPVISGHDVQFGSELLEVSSEASGVLEDLGHGLFPLLGADDLSQAREDGGKIRSCGLERVHELVEIGAGASMGDDFSRFVIVPAVTGVDPNELVTQYSLAADGNNSFPIDLAILVDVKDDPGLSFSDIDPFHPANVHADHPHRRVDVEARRIVEHSVEFVPAVITDIGDLHRSPDKDDEPGEDEKANVCFGLERFHALPAKYPVPSIQESVGHQKLNKLSILV